MDELINPIEINGIIAEGAMANDWPEQFSNCWINIYPEDDNSYDRAAELIMSDAHEPGSVVKSNTKYFPDCLAMISWDGTGNGKFIWVKDEYRNSGIGYGIGRWLRTYLAQNNVRGHHMYPNERNSTVEHLLNKFKNDYSANDIILSGEPITGYDTIIFPSPPIPQEILDAEVTFMPEEIPDE